MQPQPGQVAKHYDSAEKAGKQVTPGNIAY